MGAEAIAIVSKPANTPGFAPRPEVDGYTRRRFHGSGKRGAPTVEARYAVDVRLASSELAGALAMLEAGPAIADPRARRENRKAAIAKLVDFPGIGPWTAHYMAMRGLRWPDAFPKEDIAVRNNLGGVSPRRAEELSQAWRPWRSYAVLHIWNLAK